jgi:hypothetical protein
VGSPDWSAGHNRFIQSIALGEHKACGRVAPAVPSRQTKEYGSKLPSSQEKHQIYTSETLSIAVATSCLVVLVVGFVSGFLLSRRCRGEDYSNMPYPDQRHQLNILTEGGLNADVAYPPCANNMAAINLVLNVPPENATGKNANSTAEEPGTSSWPVFRTNIAV